MYTQTLKKKKSTLQDSKSFRDIYLFVGITSDKTFKKFTQKEKIELVLKRKIQNIQGSQSTK